MKEKRDIKERRVLYVVPYEQVMWIEKETADDMFFKLDDTTADIWNMIIKVCCGHDERFLPCNKDYDFDANIILYREMGNCEGTDTEKTFGYMLDNLNMLLYQARNMAYHTLADNIKSVYDIMNRIDRQRSSSLHLKMTIWEKLKVCYNILRTGECLPF